MMRSKSSFAKKVAMRLLLAATFAIGLAFAPALAVETAKPAAAKAKKHKPVKIDRKSAGTPQATHPLGEPYTMQKDEMTR
jgi:hypothetical protein